MKKATISIFLRKKKRKHRQTDRYIEYTLKQTDLQHNKHKNNDDAAKKVVEEDGAAREKREDRKTYRHKHTYRQTHT